MVGLADLSLVQAVDAVAKGEATSLDLLHACWANLDAVNPQVNAMIWQERDAAEAAARAADEIVRSKVRRGLLHGVPMAHKDMYYQAGKLCTCGSALRKDFRPSVTATVIERMAAAGAYVFGGLNMAEFAQNPTGHNKTFGDCHNPWNLPYITGGSSSGSGASIAARFNFMALGSDTGGSIRLPASACGVTGLKPTQTRVSRFGVMPLSFSHDNVGPLARTARDCARVLRVIAGHDPRDPTSAREKVPDYEAFMTGDLKDVRIGVPTKMFLDGADDPVVAAMEAALLVLTERGASVSRFDLPLMDAVAAYGGIVSRVEAAPIHAEWMRSDPQAYGAHISARMYPGYAIPAAYYVEALSRRGPILQAFAQEVFSPGRRAGDPDHPHLPADVGRNRYRPWAAWNRAPLHGCVGEYQAIQLSWAAGDQRAVRLRSQQLPDRSADCRPAVRGRAHPECCRCLFSGILAGIGRARRCWRASRPRWT